MVKVPDKLKNRTAEEAIAALKDKGLKPVVVFLTPEVLRKDRVDRVDPPSGTLVKAGSKVTIYVR